MGGLALFEEWMGMGVGEQEKVGSRRRGGRENCACYAKMNTIIFLKKSYAIKILSCNDKGEHKS